MKEKHAPACKQSSKADSIYLIALLNNVLIQYLTHYCVVVYTDVLEDDNVAGQLDADEDEADQ